MPLLIKKRKFAKALFILGLHNLSFDDLMQSQVQASDSGFMCLICGTNVGHKRSIRRHMREVHITSEEQYHCPSCNKYYKNRRGLSSHMTSHGLDQK